MEYAIYEIFLMGGYSMGRFVNLLPTRQEAEAFVGTLEGEHRIVELWTREIAEEDAHLWDVVVFDEKGGFEPASAPER